jgi:DNA-binding HxlR family transcriptional regulator
VVRVSEKLRRGDVMVAACPSREALQHVTSKWGMLVLIALEAGTQRFSGPRRKIRGVSERMLAQSLQDLEGDRLVDRVAYDVVPPHVEYSLTVLGREAAEKVRLLADWIEDSLPRITEARGDGKKPAQNRRVPYRLLNEPSRASAGSQLITGHHVRIRDVKVRFALRYRYENAAVLLVWTVCGSRCHGNSYCCIAIRTQCPGYSPRPSA